jgi:hypothetical protein
MAKGTKTGGGSRKGIPNKIGADLREMIHGALADAGGRAYLVTQAQSNPGAFLTLLGKTLPKELTGPGGTELFPYSAITERYIMPPGVPHPSSTGSKP